MLGASRLIDCLVNPVAGLRKVQKAFSADLLSTFRVPDRQFRISNMARESMTPPVVSFRGTWSVSTTIDVVPMGESGVALILPVRMAGLTITTAVGS